MSLVVKVSNFTTVKRVVVQTGVGQYFTQKKDHVLQFSQNFNRHRKLNVKYCRQ